MCGIAGLIGTNRARLTEALQRMSVAMAHRGPSDEGASILPFGAITLGVAHRRLSILDLSQAGHQPMIHPHSGDQIVFNGEIYNFKELRRELEDAGEQFRGHSDTEVLLHGLARWGPDYIPRLQGMFAFAFYNSREQSLLLARDSIGIKPLYIARAAGNILFASELRTLLASGMVPANLDPAGMASLLAYGAVQQPLTMIRDVTCFMPGHYQIVRSDGRMEPPVKYWEFPHVREDIDPHDLMLQIRQQLSDAVRDHLVADVPLGVFLSSGLDSTIVAALGAHHCNRLRSFTVGFNEDPDMSESHLARETAQFLDLPHTDIQVSRADALGCTLNWLDAMDQPSVDGLNTFLISKVVREAGIIVALSGQGGDELFGGYPSFQDVPRLQRYCRMTSLVPRPLRGTAARLAMLGASSAARQKFADIVDSDASTVSLALHRRRMMSDQQLEALGVYSHSAGLNDLWMPPDALQDLPLSGDVVADVSQMEARFYQSNMLLRDSDTNAMAHGLEIRVPILDKRMLNLMHAVPGSIRLPNEIADKHLLRSSFFPELRPILLKQKKRGFTLPIRRWMTGPMRAMCEHSLRVFQDQEFLRPQGVQEVWNSFINEPEAPTWTRAFTLCVLGHWLQKHKIAA